jgi:beta-glucosidase
VLSTGGPVSTAEYKHNPKVGAVLYPLFGGGMAGKAIVQLLLGEKYPSGHLQHTIAYRLEDYPSTNGFHESESYVNYTEDIFVGYRYFETFAPEKVAYPFGFGLGYTTFSVETMSAALEKNTVRLTVRVENTGSYPGREVVQAYLTAPQGVLGKAKKVLCAFQKTGELKPGEAAEVKLSFDIRQFGSFDDLGKIQKSAFLLEKGTYSVHIGTNVRDTEQAFSFCLEENIICRQCHEYMAPRALSERLTATGKMEKLPFAEKKEHPPVGKDCKVSAEKQFLLSKALKEAPANRT